MAHRFASRLRDALASLSSALVSLLRLGRGSFARSGPARPRDLLVLYEFEACPFCRKVREVLTELDLDYHAYPCGRGSAHREAALAEGGRAQFPLLVDRDAGVSRYESEAIITHLVERYGRGRRGVGRLVAPLNTFGSALASSLRHRGGRVRAYARPRPDAAPPLELYGFEASPGCRRVRERLVELDLSYVARSAGPGSRRRRGEGTSSTQVRVPRLVDRGTEARGEVEVVGARAILDYLEGRHGAPAG
jgi:glutathione S-transferase